MFLMFKILLTISKSSNCFSAMRHLKLPEWEIGPIKFFNMAHLLCYKRFHLQGRILKRNLSFKIFFFYDLETGFAWANNLLEIQKQVYVEWRPKTLFLASLTNILGKFKSIHWKPDYKKEPKSKTYKSRHFIDSRQ